MCVFEDPLKVVKAMASAIKPNGRYAFQQNFKLY